MEAESDREGKTSTTRTRLQGDCCVHDKGPGDQYPPQACFRLTRLWSGHLPPTANRGSKAAAHSSCGHHSATVVLGQGCLPQGAGCAHVGVTPPQAQANNRLSSWTTGSYWTLPGGRTQCRWPEWQEDEVDRQVVDRSGMDLVSPGLGGSPSPASSSNQNLHTSQR